MYQDRFQVMDVMESAFFASTTSPNARVTRDPNETCAPGWRGLFTLALTA